VGKIPKTFWSNILNNAQARGLEVGVSLREVWDLFKKQGGKCALTGLPIHFPPVGARKGTASLDRIDSRKGYVEGNIQWVDKRVQQMKWDMDQQEFFRLCRLVVESHIVGP